MFDVKDLAPHNPSDGPVRTAAQELQRRLSRPQRHRLLHGYPLAAAMPQRQQDEEPWEVAYGEPARRQLLVGVLPHPFCNPTVTGCGFCTFPHERYESGQAEA